MERTRSAPDVSPRRGVHFNTPDDPAGILQRPRSLSSGGELSDESIRGIFNKVDKNSDGRIVASEMIKTVRADAVTRNLLGLPADLRQQNLGSLQVFHQMDSDGNRGVDFEEFKSFMKSKFNGGRGVTLLSHALELAPQEEDSDDDGGEDESSGEEMERDLDKAEEEVVAILQEDLLREYGIIKDETGDGAVIISGGSAGDVSPRFGQKDYKHRTEYSFPVKVIAFMDSHSMVLLMMIVTVLALFGEDIKTLAMSKSMDEYWSWQTFAVFVLFGTEWVASCLFRKGYVGSLFFWLDLLAALSLITDIAFLSDAIFGASDNVAVAQGACLTAADAQANSVAMGTDISDQSQVARTGRAAWGATRAVRLIRILRVLRVLRIFKIFRFFGGFGAPGEGDDEMELRSNPTKIGSRLAEKMSQRVILVVLVLFVGIVTVMQLNEVDDNGPDAGLDWMDDFRAINGTRNQAGVVPHSAANTYVGGMDRSVLCLKDMHVMGLLFRHDLVTINERRDGEIELFWSEKGTVLSVIDTRDAATSAAWVNITMMLLILVVMVGATYIFAHDTEELVVNRISLMIQSVNKMSKTMVFLKDGDEDESMETAMIEKAFDKMSTLLRIGFGAAGNAIISKSLMGTGELNAMLPGQHVTAVFGFCDIRAFGELTDVLRGQIMPFVNMLANIVHERVNDHNGAPNKNIGEAFLSVWKTENFTVTPRNRADPAMAKKMRRLSLAPGHINSSVLGLANGEVVVDDDEALVDEDMDAGMADHALLSFTEIIREIKSQRTELLLRKKHPRLYMKYPEYKIDMGFGLHHGWAIEGAIGSMHKVDVSYLSPHVNMSARLEAASKQYSVPLLLSGTFVKVPNPNTPSAPANHGLPWVGAFGSCYPSRWCGGAASSTRLRLWAQIRCALSPLCSSCGLLLKSTRRTQGRAGWRRCSACARCR